MVLDASSRTLSPLPDYLFHGLAAVSTLALLSFFCSTSLFFFLTYRMVKWRRASTTKAPMNQFMFLIYNLLLADMQQAVAFLLNITHLQSNSIDASSPTCFAQGWFVSVGDLSSSIFICTIACHTFLGVVKNYKLPTRAFYCVVAGLWVFVYLICALGPLTHPHNFYTRASAWCWISDKFQNDRLWLQYFWMLICMFSTVLIYVYTYIHLLVKRGSSRAISPGSNSHGATPIMLLYPLIYVVCTMPLIAGRLVALSGHKVSLQFFCLSGAMIASNGWLDVLLYTSTRHEIILSRHDPGEDVGLKTFGFILSQNKFGTVTTVEVGHRAGSRDGDSVENLYNMDHIGVTGEVTVSIDVAPHAMRQTKGGGSVSWDERSSRKSSKSDV